MNFTFCVFARSGNPFLFRKFIARRMKGHAPLLSLDPYVDRVPNALVFHKISLDQKSWQTTCVNWNSKCLWFRLFTVIRRNSAFSRRANLAAFLSVSADGTEPEGSIFSCAARSSSARG